MAFIINLMLFTPAKAQTTSISIWPPILEAMIKPGKSITQVYRIKNEADETQLTVNVIPFVPADELGHLNLLFGAAAPDYFSLLNADLPDLPLTLNLKSGETRELVLKIAIPEGTAEADVPTALVVTANPVGLIGGTGATAVANIASPILLTVSQTATPNRVVKIEEFRLMTGYLMTGYDPVIDTFSPIEFLVRLKNQSLNRLRPTGQIEILNTFGRPVATLTLNDNQILGGTVRRQELTWQPVLPLGRYRAKLTVTPQDSTNTITQTITFWVIPYKAILTFCLLYLFYRSLTNLKKQTTLKSS